VLPKAEDLRHLVRRQIQQSHLATSLEDLADRRIPLEDEISAILHLVDRVIPIQLHTRSLFFRELRAQHERPVVQTLAQHILTQTVGGGLQA